MFSSERTHCSGFHAKVLGASPSPGNPKQARQLNLPFMEMGPQSFLELSMGVMGASFLMPAS